MINSICCLYHFSFILRPFFYYSPCQGIFFCFSFAFSYSPVCIRFWLLDISFNNSVNQVIKHKHSSRPIYSFHQYVWTSINEASMFFHSILCSNLLVLFTTNSEATSYFSFLFHSVCALFALSSLTMEPFH